MNRRTKGWLIAAVLFGLGNVAGAVMACAGREWIHAATHVVLAVFSGYVARELLDARPRPAVALPAGAAVEVVSERLSHLELSLAGLASGVERMRQGQRAVTREFAERAQRPSEHNRDDVS